MWRSSLRHLGEATELGPYPAGTDLVLGQTPYGVCPTTRLGPSGGPAVRVAQPTAGVWDLWWADYRTDAGADYDGLVVRIEAVP